MSARLAAACAQLATADTDLAALMARIGPCRLRPERKREPYEALLRAIAHQQLHGRAAEAILRRFIALYPPDGGFPGPAQLLATEDAALRGCGFSAGKLAALQDLAAKTLDGTVPSRRAAMRLDDAALITRLTEVRGVGRWTVEMLLIFTLGRPDVLPVDDFGVREGWRVLKSLPAQPAPRALAEIGAAFAPWRSIAAWYLWQAADAAKRKPAGLAKM